MNPPPSTCQVLSVSKTYKTYDLQKEICTDYEEGVSCLIETND